MIEESRPWWKEWDGIHPGLEPLRVGRAAGAIGAIGLITAVFLDGTPIVLLLVVVGFNLGGATVAWRLSRRLEEEEER